MLPRLAYTHASTSGRKKWLWILEGYNVALALVVVAGAVAISRVDPGAVRDFLTDSARQVTGREVVVRGATQLKLFPSPTLVAENVVFGNADWSVSPDMARVKRLEARVGVLPLFLGHREFFEIGSLVAGEFLTAFRLVQRHAEHVEVIALAIAAAVQDIGARYIIIVSACHRCPPSLQVPVVRSLLRIKSKRPDHHS